MKKIPFISLAGVVFIVLLALLSGCINQIEAQAAAPTPPPNVQPDSVQIQLPNPQGGMHTVTLTDQALVRQLYATSYGLPVLPENQFCTLEYGPHYVLTFQQHKQLLVVIKAENDGCRPVTIGNEAIQRHATDVFWKQLDQAIHAATSSTRSD
ncbi:hypothetical protein [Dictyobacter formicarum]|uniref:Lipoprotein n=1 Tax=Dictyobacter formicarum TaxID=2778368 RepID=A0ABQ3VTV9_9CHLR|nr:hypothetical protein [Dictyobacter formicarum]GHO89250.1 hypothetical protein KSZ_72560 [Dictyobacter formicarum]